MGYGERLVRDALRTWDGPRDEVLVATKTGYRRTMEEPVSVAQVSDSAESDAQGAQGAQGESAQERQHLQAAGSRYGWMADSRPETMIRDAKESASHLGVDALDLLYSHGPDPAVPYADQVGALKQLLDEGVIRYAGISRVNNEQIAAFQRECDEQYGENAALNPNNIIESKKFEITTPEVKISIAPENSYMIEARVINGRKYLLIPADDGVEVNGIGVNIPGLAKEE